MNPQEFKEWKVGEAEKMFPVKPDEESVGMFYDLNKSDRDKWERGADAAYNLLSKEISEKDAEIKGYKEWAEDVKRLTKEIDQMVNGVDAAEQASLCDIVSQMRNDATKFQEHNISIAMMEEEIERQKSISDTAFREIDRLNNIIKYSNPRKDNQL